jgi:hypothetical protein
VEYFFQEDLSISLELNVTYMVSEKIEGITTTEILVGFQYYW